jgi:hypothetical protein
LASQAAAKAGTKVYTIFYDDSSYTCTDSATAPGLSSTITSSCTAMKDMANTPGATTDTYSNDDTKFYSIDGKSSPCASVNNYSTIASIFQNIAASLETARLIPNSTT